MTDINDDVMDNTFLLTFDLLTNSEVYFRYCWKNISCS